MKIPNNTKHFTSSKNKSHWKKHEVSSDSYANQKGLRTLFFILKKKARKLRGFTPVLKLSYQNPPVPNSAGSSSLVYEESQCRFCSSAAPSGFCQWSFSEITLTLFPTRISFITFQTVDWLSVKSGHIRLTSQQLSHWLSGCLLAHLIFKSLLNFM